MPCRLLIEAEHPRFQNGGRPIEEDVVVRKPDESDEGLQMPACRAPAHGGAELITGVRAVSFTTDAERDCAFFRDVLEFPSVDAGGG